MPMPTMSIPTSGDVAEALSNGYSYASDTLASAAAFAEPFPKGEEGLGRSKVSVDGPLGRCILF